MHTRGHNLVLAQSTPLVVMTLAKTAAPAAMSAILKDHITNVASHYKGKYSPGM